MGRTCINNCVAIEGWGSYVPIEFAMIFGEFLEIP